jgi:predicted ATPase with chaperone activity
MDSPLVVIEVYISGGLPSFSIVYLPEGVVKDFSAIVRSN